MHQKSYTSRKDGATRDLPEKLNQEDSRPAPMEPQTQKTVSRDRSKIQCYCCQGFGHTVKESALKRQATEAKGGGVVEQTLVAVSQ